MISLVNPRTGHELQRSGDDLIDEAGNRFPVLEGIPRICDPNNYARNFGLQWNEFDETQIDRSDKGLALNAERLFAETAWGSADLSGLDVLEVGSGAGRFTRVILEQTQARLCSVDYSSAVEANLRNNGRVAPDRLRLVQASIYEMPFPDESFDKVLCLGVLQHTPDFEASVRALIRKAKKGGEIVVDFYPIRGWWTKLNSKYLLRPVTKRMGHRRLLKLIEANVDWLIKTYRTLDRMGLGALNRFLPIADLKYVLPKDCPAELEREWAILDTFDMFSPEHDHPQRISRVVEMFRANGATVTFADYVSVGEARAAVVRAVRD